MPLSTKLFKIVIASDYYKGSHPADDFTVEPTSSTAAWMRRRNIRLLSQADGIALIWLSDNYDHPLALFKQKAEDITCSFVVTLKNSQALNLLDLEAGHPTGQAYYLHNRHSNKNNLLHSQPYMCRSDLCVIQEIPHYPTGPGWQVFAMIDIDLNHWLDGLVETDRLLLDWDIYKIQMQSRATFWRYYVVDTQRRMRGKEKILLQGDASYFGSFNSSDESPNTYWVESTKPMPFSERYDHAFTLCASGKRGAGGELVLLDRLPYPTYDSIKKDVGSNKLYSEMVVYV